MIAISTLCSVYHRFGYTFLLSVFNHIEYDSSKYIVFLFITDSAIHSCYQFLITLNMIAVSALCSVYHRFGYTFLLSVFNHIQYDSSKYIVLYHRFGYTFLFISF